MNDEGISEENIEELTNYGDQEDQNNTNCQGNK